MQTTSAQGVKTVIIDPGHGGDFPGAEYSGFSEKDINLKVSLRLNEILKKGHPELKVIMTRTKDVALGKTLKEDLGKRSQIANEANGDLFISIHSNAAPSSAAYGVETLIMGETPLEKQRNDAALYSANQDYLIDMSDEKNAAIVRAYIQNLQFTYGQYSEALARLIQNNYGKYDRKLRPVRKQPIMVLYGTDMPCVLTEIGFMTNATELAYITSKKGTEEVAQAIYGGIDEYIKMVNKTSTNTGSGISSTNDNIKSGYTIQILASKKELPQNDSQFKIYKGQQWMKLSTSQSSKYKYLYCLGKYNSKGEAEADLAEVRKTFSGAYVTQF
ncbi:MAG: N-acetylmuramoyl-L-alanine amidase [Rikenellaceae bacterium]